MAHWQLDLTIISAMDLRKRDVYAVATLGDNPRSMQWTPVDKVGGKNPTWNFIMKFSIPTTSNHTGLVLHIQLYQEHHIQLYHDRGRFRHQKVGEVDIPIKDLLDAAPSDGSQAKRVGYHVITPSGFPKGILYISYKLTYPATVAGTSAYSPPAGRYPYPLPPQAYPPAGYVRGYLCAWEYGYGAQQPGYGYTPPAPQQPGYGYTPPAPQQPGYGYPPPAPQQRWQI